MEAKISLKVAGIVFLISFIGGFIGILCLFALIGAKFIDIKNNIISDNQLIINSIKESAEKIAERKYIDNIYDCKNFSKDLVIELAKKNISSYCVIGRVDNIGHEWVETIVNNETIDIEATNGELFSLESRNYYVYMRGVCV